MPRLSPDQPRREALAALAASWAGGAFVPNQAATATASPSVVHVHNYLNGKEIGKGLVLDPRAISAAAQEGDRQRRQHSGRVR